MPLPKVVVFDLEVSFAPSARIWVAVAKQAAACARVDVVLSGDPGGHSRQLEPFAAALDGADYVVARNGHMFDARVLENYFSVQRIAAWEAKLIDLTDEFDDGDGVPWGTRTSLSDMLSANGLASEPADCRSDVDRMCALWEKRHVRVHKDDSRVVDLHTHMAPQHRECGPELWPSRDAEYLELYGELPDGEEEDLELWGEGNPYNWDGDVLIGCT